MGCLSPIWEVDDLSACFRHRYIQAILPLTACAVSLSLLLIYFTIRWLPLLIQCAARQPVSTSNTWSSGLKWLGRPESTLDGGTHVFAPTRRSFRLSLAAFEQLLVLSQIGIGLASLLTNPRSHSRNVVALAESVTWSYIFTLNLVRIIIFVQDKAVFRTLWLHSAVLYHLQWVFTLVIARSSIIHQTEARPRAFALANCALVTLLVVIVTFTPAYQTKHLSQRDPVALEPSQEAQASVFGLATFQWVDSLVWKGYKRTLELQDVWALSDGDEAINILQGFRNLRSTGSLAWRLLRYFQGMLLIQAGWAALLSITTFAPTLLLRAILEYVENPSKTPINVAWLYVMLMFIIALLSACTQGQATWIGQKISLRLRSIAIAEVYEKALRRKAVARSSTVLGMKATNSSDSSELVDTQVNVGTIINLMSVDAFHLGEVGASLYLLWVSVPTQIVIALALLYQVLGLSAIPGIAMMLLMFPINSVLAKQFGKIQMEVMRATDLRIETTNEMLRNIRIIKYFTWEQQCQKVVGEKRAEELQILRKRFILWSVAATIWYGAPLLITFLSFVSYTVVEKKDLKASIAFTALSLFNLLKVPLDQFADILAKVQSSLASVNRIEEFLSEEETGKYSQLEHDGTNSDSDDTTKIGFDNATFSWESDYKRNPDEAGSPFSLKDIDVKFVLGSLNLIVGPTGSGKSSMLLALLGEMTLQHGKVYLPHAPRYDVQRGLENGLTDSVAYCAQTPWLVNDTIRQNIIFTSNWDERRYKAVIACCALERDLELAAAGDATFIGEKGISLSGGQKQRIALARAIYSSAKHVLLDDCLSAVDSHTAKWIFDRCICGPLMQNRTCILVTHNVALCIPRADLVVVLEHGAVVACDSSSNIIASGTLGQDSGNTQSKSSSQVTSVIEGLFADDTVDEDNADRNSQNNTFAKTTPGEEGNSPAGTMVETKAEGHIKWSIIYKYLATTGGPIFWLSLTVVFVAQLLGSIITNVWIREFSNAYSHASKSNSTPYTNAPTTPAWAMHTSLLHQKLISIQPQLYPLTEPRTNPEVDTGYYLGVYALLLLGFLIVSFLRMLLVSFGSLAASRKLHDRLVTSVFRARFSFFDRTPHGQIMNRFSKDIETVDQEIASIALGTIHFVGSVICILILIAIITPAFIVAGIFISFIYWIIGKLYINSSRDLKRIESVQRSPLYQHFGETLAGTVTIRAYGEERLFMRKNLDRVDTLNRPFISLWAVDRWLAFRLDATGGLVAFFAGSLAILGIGRVDAGAVGLSLTYAITFSENILWLVRYHALNQQNFTSVERIQEFVDVEQEPQAIASTATLPEDWPAKGAVDFVDYSTRYRSDLEPVLKHVSVHINSLEKVGVVGRTGAGKSSLALALLRVLEPQDGSILIDGVDISSVALNDLRQAVTLVPQDPTLFSGTLRFNLDPFELSTDAELFTALRKVQLIGPSNTDTPEAFKPQIASSDGDDQRRNGSSPNTTKTFFSNLASVLVDSGANMSQGQRQLLCLARAMLRGSKIIIMDEATASVDYSTDLKIQKALDAIVATNITIAHRLQTIINFDKVLVLDHGEIKEFGHPFQLLQDKKGLFRAMCETNGNVDDLEKLAEESWEKKTGRV